AVTVEIIQCDVPDGCGGTPQVGRAPDAEGAVGLPDQNHRVTRSCPDRPAWTETVTAGGTGWSVGDDRDVELPVVIEVTHGERFRRQASRIDPRQRGTAHRLERAVAVAQPNHDPLRVRHRRDVEPPVAVEIADLHLIERRFAGGGEARSLERAAGVPEQHTYAVEPNRDDIRSGV